MVGDFGILGSRWKCRMINKNISTVAGRSSTSIYKTQVQSVYSLIIYDKISYICH